MFTKRLVKTTFNDVQWQSLVNCHFCPCNEDFVFGSGCELVEMACHGVAGGGYFSSCIQEDSFQLFFTAKACLEMGAGVGVSAIAISFGHMIATRAGARALVDHDKLLLAGV